MENFDIYKKFIFPEGRTKYLLGLLILGLLLSGYLLVIETGGTQYAYLHILYVPIILGGFIFSLRGGIVTGFLAGLLIGPYMPTNMLEMTMQPFSSWGLRMFFFVLVGAFAGLASSVFKNYLKELELKNTTNPLTGLPNIIGLRNIFSKLTENTEKSIVIIVVELFQMNEIDRALGTEGSADLIKQVAAGLKNAVGDKAILGHFQPQRFALIVPDENDVKSILDKCEPLSEATYHVGSIPLFVEMRFGISRYPYDDRDLSNLTRKAQIAINAPKNQTESISHFDKESDDSSEKNLMILHQLKKAIDNKSLILEYQPKVYIQTDKVMGFESLVRWVDPLLGAVNPMNFIPLAEDTLLINPLTKWLLESAVIQLAEWKKQGIIVPVSVNFSNKNFHDPALMASVNELLNKYKIPPHFLEIEVTETSVAASLTHLSKVLEDLKEVGVRVAIDDFGTGQASQQYLFELPIDVIKLDKVFVQSISHNPAAAAIVKNAISLAHDLKMEVIAEGVETHNQYNLLKEWGCDAVQGFLVSRSMKPDAATQWLKKREASNVVLLNSD